MELFFRKARVRRASPRTKKPLAMKKNGTAVRAISLVNTKSAVALQEARGEVCMATTSSAAAMRKRSMPRYLRALMPAASIV